LLAVLAYVEGVMRGRRRWAVVLVPTVALMVYGHNWALFFCVGLALATILFARERLGLFALVAAGVALLYVPWLPTLYSQVQHTGAPWSTKPSFHELFTAAGAVLGGDAALVAFVIAGFVGLATWGRVERALAVLIAATVALAWLGSQITPAWTTRYFSVVLGPVVLLAAVAVGRSGRIGVLALFAVLFLWWGFNPKDDKENARRIARQVAPVLHHGELVISTHPEQVPVLRYYLGPGLRWATTLGPVSDAQVFDWQDAVSRLRAARPRIVMPRVLSAVPLGGEFVVITPLFRDYRAWRAKWTRLVWRRSQQWTVTLANDQHFRLEHHFTTDEIAVKFNYFKPVQAFIYRRVG